MPEASIELSGFGFAQQIDPLAAGELQAFGHQVSPYPFSSPAFRDGKVGEIRLQFSVAEQLGEPDDLAIVDRYDGPNARCRQHAQRAFRIGREGRPALGDTQAQDTVEVSRLELPDRHHRAIVSLRSAYLR
jgi:hypothetical protein